VRWIYSISIVVRGKKSCGLLLASVGLKRLRAYPSAQGLYEYEVVNIRETDNS